MGDVKRGGRGEGGREGRGGGKGGKRREGDLPLYSDFLPVFRSSQYITVESGDSSSLIHYDYLALCTGTQYQVPRFTGISNTPPPRNVFTVNGEHEAASLVQWVRAKFNNKAKGENKSCSLISYSNATQKAHWKMK